MNHETVKKAVIDKLAQSRAEHLQFTDLTMKADGLMVTIQPWINDTYHAFFEKCHMCATAKSLDELVTWLMEYPKKADELQAQEDSYRAEEEPKIRRYFAEHFAGKTWEEIDGDEWSWYSDWHKDVFGYRPHGIVCGEYINPYTGRKEPCGCA